MSYKMTKTVQFDEDGDENDDPFALLNEDYIDSDGDVIYSVSNVPDYSENYMESNFENIEKIELDNEQIMNKFENNIRSTLKNGPRSEEKLNLKEIAAKIIQRYWKRFIDRMIFKYVQNHLYNCIQNPMTIMKNVNPLESQLLDVISGTFIRFRLCGKHFPPKIVYKIFTIRPVVGIGDTTQKREQKVMEEYPKFKCAFNALPTTSLPRCPSSSDDWRVCVDTDNNMMKKLQQILKLKQNKAKLKKTKLKAKPLVSSYDKDTKMSWISEILNKYSQVENKIDEITDYFIDENEF